MWSFLFWNKRNLFLFLKQLETVFSSYLPENNEKTKLFLGNNLEWPTLTINLFNLLFCKTFLLHITHMDVKLISQNFHRVWSMTLTLTLQILAISKAV